MTLIGLRGDPLAVSVTGVCPSLPPPTMPAVDALDGAARADAATARWVIDLDQHYDALARCGAGR